MDIQDPAPTPKTHNPVTTVRIPVLKREGPPFSLRPGLDAGMRSEVSLADTVVTESSFGEVLERCNSRGAMLSEDINEERKIRDGELYG